MMDRSSRFGPAPPAVPMAVSQRAGFPSIPGLIKNLHASGASRFLALCTVGVNPCCHPGGES